MRVGTMLLAAMPLFGQWEFQRSGAGASLRGLCAVSARIAWASGTGGTVLRTVDGGRKWELRPVPEAGTLDFRDIEAWDDRVAVVMSAGPGRQSRVYRTEDGGARWQLLLENADEKGFYDAIAFWDRRRGLLLGDATSGRMTVLRTGDGGLTWTRVEALPPALDGEGAFAASGTCLVTGAQGGAWFATGAARVYRSSDGGLTWRVSGAPVRHDQPGAGIFSLAFRDARHGLAAGGAFPKPDEDRDNLAVSEDRGITWTRPVSRPSGYRSAVVFAGGRAIAAGPNGTDESHDGGRTWRRLGAEGFHALSVADGVVWACGANGRVARLRGYR